MTSGVVNKLASDLSVKDIGSHITVWPEPGVILQSTLIGLMSYKLNDTDETEIIVLLGKITYSSDRPALMDRQFGGVFYTDGIKLKPDAGVTVFSKTVFRPKDHAEDLKTEKGDPTINSPALVTVDLPDLIRPMHHDV